MFEIKVCVIWFIILFFIFLIFEIFFLYCFCLNLDGKIFFVDLVFFINEVFVFLGGDICFIWFFLCWFVVIIEDLILWINFLFELFDFGFVCLLWIFVDERICVFICMCFCGIFEIVFFGIFILFMCMFVKFFFGCCLRLFCLDFVLVGICCVFFNEFDVVFFWIDLNLIGLEFCLYFFLIEVILILFDIDFDGFG